MKTMENQQIKQAESAVKLNENEKEQLQKTIHQLETVIECKY